MEEIAERDGLRNGEKSVGLLGRGRDELSGLLEIVLHHSRQHRDTSVKRRVRCDDQAGVEKLDGQLILSKQRLNARHECSQARERGMAPSSLCLFPASIKLRKDNIHHSLQAVHGTASNRRVKLLCVLRTLRHPAVEDCLQAHAQSLISRVV